MEERRGLNITHYEEDDCFSMSSIDIVFNELDCTDKAADKENPSVKKIDKNIMHVIGRVLYAKIKGSDYYKEGWFSNYIASDKFGKISFCLTPSVSEKEALKYVQSLFLDLMSVDLRKKSIIDIVGMENLPKMEAELEEAKSAVWDLLEDITIKKMVYTTKKRY